LVCILYNIAYKLVGGVVNEFGQYGYHSIDDFYQNSFWSKYYVKFPVMYGTAIFIILPLCLMKNISKMRFNSIFGIMSLIFITLIIVIQSPWYISNYWDNLYKEDIPSTHLNILNVSSGFDENLYFFKGTATLFFAYSCHYGAFPVYKELKNNVLRRIQKVFFRSIVLDATIYTIVGLIGYLSAPLGTPDLIIERYKLFENDTVMAFGWIMFTFTFMMKIPANYNTLRLSIVCLI
jgi:amino acid permease